MGVWHKEFRLSTFLMLGAISGMTLCIAQKGFAEPTLRTASVTSNGTLLQEIKERTSLSYFGTYHGGALGDLGNPYQPQVDGSIDTSSPQYVENQLTTGYKINQNMMVGVIWHFNYSTVSHNTAWNDQHFQMLDPILTLAHSKLFTSGGFNLSGRLAAALPVSSMDSLKPSHLATYLAPTLSVSYNIPRTNLTVGLYGYLKGYIPTAQAVDDRMTYKIYVAPNATYQISDKVAATLWVDLIQASRRHRTGFISGLQNAEADIEPGINWDISKNISINPVINIYPSNPTLASTSILAFVTARAF